MPTIESYCADDVYDPPAYSQGVRVKGAETILFLSGQVSYDNSGGVAHAGDFKAQARAAFEALKSLIEHEGGGLENIVKLNSYVVDMGYRNDLALVRGEFFPGRAPASTLVEVSALALPDWLVEIEAIAVL